MNKQILDKAKHFRFWMRIGAVCLIILSAITINYVALEREMFLCLFLTGAVSSIYSGEVVYHFLNNIAEEY